MPADPAKMMLGDRDDAKQLELINEKYHFNSQVAGKTGTSQKFRDAWFVGYDKSMLTGVWHGNEDCRPMLSVSGGSIPASIWKSIMLQIN